jgi:protein phosphatase
MDRDVEIINPDLQPAEYRTPRPGAGLRMDFGARSDVGRVRTNNEDNYLMAPDLSLMVLSDGMGAMASGEVASRLTVETVQAYYRDASGNPLLPLVGKRIEEVSEASNRLASAIQLANQIVYTKAQTGADHQKMGATVVAVHYVDGRMSLAHVGDSRAYRLRGERLDQLTRDHSFLAELELQPGRYKYDPSNLQHLLTRAVGIEPEVKVEVRDELVMESDTFLLCSDGLTRELSDNQIAWVLRQARTAQEGAEQLVALANEAGGKDNITAIVIRHGSRHCGARSGIARVRNWFRRRGN